MGISGLDLVTQAYAWVIKTYCNIVDGIVDSIMEWFVS